MEGGAQMRLNEVEVNPSTQKLEIDIMANPKAFMIVVCDGKARMTDLPVHGETKVVTHQGKVKRVKWDEGEDF
jgi:Phage-like element PBSX protein XtrA